MVALAQMDESEETKTKRAFGLRLRNIRKQKGFSQEGLALACGLDRSYVGGVERGERNISLINIKKIADAIGVSARELLP
jgi:transcriptional regulator with XRE-family HTH domain